MKMKNLLALASATLALCLMALTVNAQGGGGPGGGFGPGGGAGGGGFGPGGGGGGGFGAGGGGGGGGFGRGGVQIDAAQIQQALLDSLRQEFEVTNDDDWKIISDQVMKVYTAAQDYLAASQNITRLAQLRGKSAGTDAAEAYRLRRFYV